jgi:hypothetical protein
MLSFYQDNPSFFICMELVSSKPSFHDFGESQVFIKEVSLPN